MTNTFTLLFFQTGIIFPPPPYLSVPSSTIGSGLRQNLTFPQNGVVKAKQNQATKAI